MPENFDDNDKIILRDYLALERTRLANERTLFAFIRTSLYMLLAGIAIVQLEGLEPIKLLGYLLLILCVVTLIFGVIRFVHFRKKLRRYYGK